MCDGSDISSREAERAKKNPGRLMNRRGWGTDLVKAGRRRVIACILPTRSIPSQGQLSELRATLYAVAVLALQPGHLLTSRSPMPRERLNSVVRDRAREQRRTPDDSRQCDGRDRLSVRFVKCSRAGEQPPAVTGYHGYSSRE